MRKFVNSCLTVDDVDCIQPPSSQSRLFIRKKVWRFTLWESFHGADDKYDERLSQRVVGERI
jgi:hypothetical protein